MANTFIGSGRLTRDAEIRPTSGGLQLCTFEVAVDTRKSDGPLRLRVTAWAKLADQCADLKDGARVLVQGALKMGRWNGNDGKERQQVELTASSVELLTGSEESPAERPSVTPAKSGPTFRTTRIPAPGTAAQGTLPTTAPLPGVTAEELERDLF